MKTFWMTFLKMSLIIGTLTLGVGCGESNSSGNNPGSATTGTAGVPPGAGGINDPGSFAHVVAQEIGCRDGGQRQTFQIAAPISPNSGNSHIGVSAYGDIAVLSGTPGQAVLTLYICQTPGWNIVSQPQLISRPVANYSERCQVGEITGLNLALNLQRAGGGAGGWGTWGGSWGGGQQQVGVSFSPLWAMIPNSRLCSGFGGGGWLP